MANTISNIGLTVQGFRGSLKGLYRVLQGIIGFKGLGSTISYNYMRMGRMGLGFEI